MIEDYEFDADWWCPECGDAGILEGSPWHGYRCANCGNTDF